MRPLRLALLGSRGIPASYGGFETLMEELATRLVQRGHEVTVYCRSRYTPANLDQVRDVRLVRLPTLYTKYTETPVHTALSCLHAMRAGFDAVVLVNGANAIFAPLLTTSGTPVALNVDGIERQRAKWGPIGRAVYAASERLAVALPNRVITDAAVIRDYYARHYGAETTMIPYGVDPQPLPPGPVLDALGLESRRYFLYVSRFEPENNPHRVAEEYRAVDGDLPLVMVGGAPYATSFIAAFTEGADSRIVFPGPVYGDGYRELLSHALAYIQATEVGGTHPALVEAMGYGNCVLVNDTPENREVAGESATYFRFDRPGSLASACEQAAGDAAATRAAGELAARRARDRYSWERVADQYESLLGDLLESARW